MPNLVLVRHGQSAWNLENRFTGWVDVDLTARGSEEARAGGRELARERLRFDVAYTSVLKRAIRTLWIVLEEIDHTWIPVHRHWRLNERFYGGLTGLDKSETAAKHGEDQVHVWRRSYDVPPPPIDEDTGPDPRKDRRYAHLDPRLLPDTESLKLTLERVLPYWHDAIAPELRAGRDVLVVAHGNSLRALVKYLEAISDDDITGLNIPTGIPRLYRLEPDLRVAEARYLGDPEAAAQAARAVADQGRQGSGT
ncbi:MAG TPA: 2,3-diphosphoglycerate-dependent phosphoglycerate mutase [Myxococcales bacterium LLY-WYZ-16_1]|jgi:2,3-bisphosphoglycerate-dependent phosphoglycerate mutase|nr:2,3-diphosphoglycerate-dependent phosphoglycerate mutase [Myxococcales bacterium LLY-WYZ-16_1]